MSMTDTTDRFTTLEIHQELPGRIHVVPIRQLVGF